MALPKSTESYYYERRTWWSWSHEKIWLGEVCYAGSSNLGAGEEDGCAEEEEGEEEEEEEMVEREMDVLTKCPALLPSPPVMDPSTQIRIGNDQDQWTRAFQASEC